MIIEHLRSAARRAHTFCIGGMNDAVQQIFQIINLGKAMPVFATRKAPLKAVEKRKIKGPEKPLFAPAD